MQRTDKYLVLLALLTINTLCIYAGDYKYKILSIDVPLDHFSFASNQTFKIRLVYILLLESYSFAACFLIS